jgi:hypothetical protein
MKTSVKLNMYIVEHLLFWSSGLDKFFTATISALTASLRKSAFAEPRGK